MSTLEGYDWESNLKTNILVIRIIGLWPAGDGTYNPGLYLIYSSIILTLVACHLLSEIISIYFVRDDLEKVAEAIYIVLTEIATAIKTTFVIKKIKIIKSCLHTLKNNDSFQPKNLNQILAIQSSVVFWKFVYKSFILGCFGVNFFWMITSMNFEQKYAFPFLAWYPYNAKRSPQYEITYFYQMACTSFLTLSALCVDALICVFNVYVGVQFDFLSDKLRTFANTDKNDAVQARRNLTRCIVHHKQILRFVQSCSRFYNPVLFWYIIIIGVSLGVTMFRLTLVEPFCNEFYTRLSFALATTVEIFMYCYFGNEVYVKSNKVSYAAFESGWPNLPQDIKRSMIIFIENVLTPVKISAFNLFVLSPETLITILKTAWSYFVLLSQLSV